MCNDLNPNAAYTLKLGRAEKHLRELRETIPFKSESQECVAVREIDPNSNVWRFTAHLEQKASPELGLIVGDIVHNLRAALDHMATALRPSERLRNGQFPILRDDIWAANPNAGEELDNIKRSRDDFESNVRGMHPDAVAIIRSHQPHIESASPGVHPLAVISALDNADKHFALAVVATGIQDPETTLSYNGPERYFKLTYGAKGTVVEGGRVGELRINHNTLRDMGVELETERDFIIRAMRSESAEVDVKIIGTPRIAVELRELKQRGAVLRLPDVLEHSLSTLKNDLFPLLEPFTE